MEISELEKIADEFLADNYGLIREIPIKRNNRLRTTLGRYMETLEGTPLGIDVAGNVLEYADEIVVIDTLLHECVHYALHRLGKPYYDGEPYFEEELRKHGITSTETNNVGKYFTYVCAKCGEEYETRRQRVASHPDDYLTNCCLSKLLITGERIFNGTEAVS